LQVIDRELAGLAVIGVTAQRATATGRPGVGNGYPLPPEEVPQLRDGRDRVGEVVVVAGDEEVDLLDRGLRQSRGQLRLALRLLRVELRLQRRGARRRPRRRAL